MTYAQMTAATALRLSVLDRLVPDEVEVSSILRGWAEDKGYDIGTIIAMANRNELDDFLASFIFPGSRNGPETKSARPPYDYFGSRLRGSVQTSRFLKPYQGDVADDIRFRTANTAFNNGPSNFYGEGAAASYNDMIYGLSRDARRVTVAVVGGGAAGAMTANALTRLGFSVTIFDPEPNGIWNKSNVHQGSRNNPRTLNFLGRDLAAAPGDGKTVLRFIERQMAEAQETRDLTVIKEKVIGIRPGHLRHFVKTKTHGELEFAIVINAIGHGDPKELNDPGRMQVIGEAPAALRWQKAGLTAQDVAGKRFIFVGLGNSTAEMIRQLHQFEDEGYEIDYRILTHYPLDAIMNPSEVVNQDGTNFRVFRDLSAPNLTSFQGDLTASRQDYFRALNAGRIMSDVTAWGIKRQGEARKATINANGENIALDVDQIYALTGYKQTAKRIQPFGCSFDTDTEAVRYDYDGEMVKDPTAKKPQDRLHMGYFGIGAITDAPHNRNAIVIPGMISGLPTLLGGVVLRAEQVVRGRQNA